ncbi:hypothetical protein [Paenibacillus sp. LHD-38]|nr:hypothetical protein [Paenibacillus sp. LHD-38]MDQ8735593.1 hypothetical protein [Paenibacillus sp. LHD-38]
MFKRKYGAADRLAILEEVTSGEIVFQDAAKKWLNLSKMKISSILW